MAAAFVVPAELESLFARFLARDPDKSEQFIDGISRFCLSLAHHYAWSLPADVQREVVSETVVALLSPNVRQFDPARGNIKKYLTGFVLNAVRRLRVLYPSLNRINDVEHEEVDSTRLESVPTLDQVEAGKECPVLEVESPLVAKIDLHRILVTAPVKVAMALRAVHVDEEPLSGLAAQLGVSRFTLKRQMDAFIASQRVAEAGRGVYA